MTINVYEQGHFEPLASLLVSSMLVLASLALVLVYWLDEHRERRQTKRDRALLQTARSLAEGPATLGGIVEFARGETVALRVTVTQVGFEDRHTNGGKSYGFSESKREVIAKPFYLRCASGERVRVEPGTAKVELDAEFDQREWLQPRERRWRKQLARGATVLVEGELRRGHDPEGSQRSDEGYRGTHAGWVLVPRDHGLLVRVLPAQRDARRTWSRVRASFVAAVLCGASMICTAGYWGRVGEPDVETTYAGRTTWIERDGKRREVERYGARYLIPGTRREIETATVSAGTFERLPDVDLTAPLAHPQKIWVRLGSVRGRSAIALGRGNTLNQAGAMMHGALLVAIAYTVLRRRWELRQGEAVLREAGVGALPRPTNERFAEP
jgi:hypothetical protein